MHVQVKGVLIGFLSQSPPAPHLNCKSDAGVIQTKGQLKHLKWHGERGVGCYWNETFWDRHFLQWMDDLKFIRNRNVPSIQGYLSETWWDSASPRSNLERHLNQTRCLFLTIHFYRFGTTPCPPYLNSIWGLARSHETSHWCGGRYGYGGHDTSRWWCAWSWWRGNDLGTS